MKLDNMCEGLIVKNYKEMCSLLNENIKTGNSKKSQLKDWERYFEYHKDGNKFIIDEIYDEPKETINKSFVYSNYIPKLILDLLAQKENNGQVFLSCNQLLRKLQMVSQNYSKGRNDIIKLSEILKIDKDIIEDVFSYTHTKLKTALETSLNILEKQCWIEWHKKKTVCIKKVIPSFNDLGEVKLNKKNEPVYEIKTQYREATLEECQMILKYESETLEELDCKDKSELFASNQIESFRNKVNKNLKENCNICFYYDSYEIITHKETLLKRLGRFERVETYDDLNNTILDQTYKSIETKHNNSIDKVKNQIGEKKYKNITDEIRADNNYVDTSKSIINKMISRKARRINGL